jgi:acyl-coenzyme A synthetase/AMP-(fatty) acid ligase
MLGRRGDIITVRGERVSPKEIENVLCRVEDVIEARVKPVPDDVSGNAIEAEVVLHSNSTADFDRILNHCRANFEDIPVREYIEIVRYLPKSRSGKILRRN